MRAVGVGVAVAVGVVLMPAGALAAKGTIKDERSSGSGYSKTIEASCDVRAVTAEKSKKSLFVAVTMRGGSSKQVKVDLNINTKGGARSVPEYSVDSEAGVAELNGVDKSGSAKGYKSAGAGTVATSGKLVRFTIPLRLLGKSSKKVAVQAQSCGEGAVDIAPGKDYFGKDFDRVAYQFLTAVPAKRVIEGEVRVDCAGARSCRRLAVKDAKVTASGGGRKFTGFTDERGRYELSVKRSTYTVRANADPLRIKTKAQRVDLKRRKSGKADFQACGMKRSMSAVAAAVGGGIWKGGNEDCLNFFQISWRASMGLTIGWVSIPVCTAVGGNHTGKPVAVLRDQALDPSRQGENLNVADSRIGFFYPINSVHSGNSVNGELRADGSGTVSAKYVQGLCTSQISKLKLRRG